MDETIIETVGFIKEILEYYFEKFSEKKIGFDNEDFMNFYGNEYYNNLKNEKHAGFEETFHKYFRGKGIEIPKTIEIYKNAHIKMKPNAENVINCLKKNGHEVFLFTGGDLSKLTAEQTELFSKTFCIKPKRKEAFEKMFRSIGINKKYQCEKVYIIGDDIFTDIKYGNELGCKTIYYANGNFNYRENKEGITPLYKINDLIEILDIIPYSSCA